MKRSERKGGRKDRDGGGKRESDKEEKRRKAGNKGKVCVKSQYCKEQLRREVCLITSPGIAANHRFSLTKCNDFCYTMQSKLQFRERFYIAIL